MTATSPPGVLTVALVSEGGVLLLAVALLFAHGAWLRARERRTARALERGRAALYHAATEGSFTEEDAALLRSLPERLRVRVFVELAPSLGGSHRTTFAPLARAVGLPQHAAQMCGSRRWNRRLRGVRLLAAIGGGEDVVPSLFRDPNADVRAEAVEWAVQHPTPQIVASLVSLLSGSPDAARFALLDTLMRIGGPVVDPLADYLSTHSAAPAVPALEVALALPDSRFAPSALRLCADALPEVRACAAALLGSIGGEAAVEVLTRLLADEAASVRAAAVSSLGRLGHWPAAPAISRLLRDPAWSVRRAAGLALRTLGSAGELLLRRSLADDDRFAAEMARQVLDLPAAAAEGGVR